DCVVDLGPFALERELGTRLEVRQPSEDVLRAVSNPSVEQGTDGPAATDCAGTAPGPSRGAVRRPGPAGVSRAPRQVPGTERRAPKAGRSLLRLPPMAPSPGLPRQPAIAAAL